MPKLPRKHKKFWKKFVSSIVCQISQENWESMDRFYFPIDDGFTSMISRADNEIKKI